MITIIEHLCPIYLIDSSLEYTIKKAENPQGNISGKIAEILPSPDQWNNGSNDQ
jgi:hypothetical protein